MVANVLQLVPTILASFTANDVFCMGYYFALVTKLVDFRVNSFYLGLILNAIFITARWIVVTPLYPEQTILIFCLELLPIALSFQAEKAERSTFDTMFKSKNMLLKFKQLLTEYLPNPITVLALDNSKTLFTNDAFNKVFEKCDSNDLNDIFNNLIIDCQNSEDNKSILRRISQLIGHSEDPDQFRLSSLIQVLHQSKWIFSQSPMISFQLRKETVKIEEISVNKDKERTHLLKSDSNSISQKPLLSANCEQGSMVERSHLDFNKKDIDISATTPFITAKSNSNKFEQTPPSSKEPVSPTPKTHNQIFKVKMFPLTWDEQEAIAILFDDVTYERTIMELNIADKNKDLVIAMVSHELRTPINGMLGLLEMMKKEVQQQTEVMVLLNACKTSSRLLLNLVNSILDFSQIKHSKLRLVYSRVVIRDLLCEIKSLFNHFCQMKNLFLKIEIDSDMPEVIITDQTRLSQIIINLVGNAFKFTFQGGVTLRVNLARNDPNRIKISVIDTGIGIKKEDQQKLFKVFGKLEQQDKNINTQGVGLGLTISNDLAILLDSREKKGIQVESEVSKGTIFSFHIQLETKDKLDEKANEKSGDEESCLDNLEEISLSMTVLDKMVTHSDVTTRRGMFVVDRYNSTDKSSIQASIIASQKKQKIKSQWCLIVDDNPFNLMVATNTMQEKGFRVKNALTGQEAISIVKEHNINADRLTVILMDCQMPVMDGYETTRILTQMMREGEVEECPIIALTANNQDEAHEKICRDAGMCGSVQKPFNVKELEEMIRKLGRSKDYEA